MSGSAAEQLRVVVIDDHRALAEAFALAMSVVPGIACQGVAWTAAAVNYGLFVVIVLAYPGIEPLVALVVSSAVAMVFAYLGLRFAAFRQRGGGPPQNAAPGQEPVHAGDEDRHAADSHHHHGQAPQPGEDNQDRDRCDRQHERKAGQPHLGPRRM